MKIAIAGYGVEGRANYDYWRKKDPNAEILIFDEREIVDDLPANAQVFLSSDFSEAFQCDLVIRTAGLAPRKLLDADISAGKIWSGTNEFFAHCPAPIVGVTGTKGKGTTCSLIASILRTELSGTGSDDTDRKRKVWLLGNIGDPALASLDKITPDDIVVYELSSFQLWDIQRSPQVAIITNIEPDHLDVHENMAEYVLAKSNVVKFQNTDDQVIYWNDDALVREIAEASKAQQLPFPNKKCAHTELGRIMYGSEEIMNMNELKLPGEHNVRNVLAAVTGAKLFGVSNESCRGGILGFEGLPHRLKFVANIAGVDFYDDSIATTPGSVIAALNSFQAPKVLILGGRDKGGDYSEMIAKINVSNVRAVVTIGENGGKLANLLRESTDTVVREIDSFGYAGLSADQAGTLGREKMHETVLAAFELAAPGDVVILSPAASSFDMFRNYAVRGEMYVAEVNSLR